MAITHNNSPDKTAIRIPILVRQTSQQIAQHIHLPLWEAGEKTVCALYLKRARRKAALIVIRLLPVVCCAINTD